MPLNPKVFDASRDRTAPNTAAGFPRTMVPPAYVGRSRVHIIMRGLRACATSQVQVVARLSVKKARQPHAQPDNRHSVSHPPASGYSPCIAPDNRHSGSRLYTFTQAKQHQLTERDREETNHLRHDRTLIHLRRDLLDQSISPVPCPSTPPTQACKETTDQTVRSLPLTHHNSITSQRTGT